MNITDLNKKINCTTYAVNNSKSYMRLTADVLTRIEFASSLVEQGILSEDLYKNFVSVQKVEIKDALASVYAYLHLEDVKGHIDHAFTIKQNTEIDRLRKALSFYADPKTYDIDHLDKHGYIVIDEDGGEKARQALEPAKGEDTQ